MTSFDPVLVATDFSRDAQHAAERAARLCADTGAAGTLLHVVEASWLERLKRLVALPAGVDDTVLAAAEAAMQNQRMELQAQTGRDMQTEVRVGRVLDVLLEAAESYRLLVLGARGTHPLRDFAVGTTAERLIRQTPTPILVVRRPAPAAYARIMVAVDFSADSARAVQHALALAGTAQVHLVHVFEAPFATQMRLSGVADEVIEEYRAKSRQEAEVGMHGFLAVAGVEPDRVQTRIEHGTHPPSQLLATARTLGADLVVVGKHGKSLTERLLLGSVTLHVLGEAPTDVLVAQ